MNTRTPVAILRPARRHRKTPAREIRRRILGASAASLLSLLAIPGSAFAATVAPATFWLGQTDGTWTGNNWASDAAGTPTTAIPGAADNVTFSATGAAHQYDPGVLTPTTRLGANFTIQSLTISDPLGVAIYSGAGGPFALTLSGTAGTGIDVQAGAGFVSIGGSNYGLAFANTVMANVTLAGASDTITVNNAAGAVITTPLAGGNGLKKEGGGMLTLTAASTMTGGTTVNKGTLTIDSTLANGNPALIGITDYFSSGALGSGATTVNGGNKGTGNGGTLKFINLASAGSGTFTTNGGGSEGAGYGGSIHFYLGASAGSGTFTTNGGANLYIPKLPPGMILVDSQDVTQGGSVVFHDYSFAGTGNFTTNGGLYGNSGGGTTSFHDHASAYQGTFTTNSGTSGAPGTTGFYDNATADHGTFITNGGNRTVWQSGPPSEPAPTNLISFVFPYDSSAGGSVTFANNSTAGRATFTTNGGNTMGARGGNVYFGDSATAGSATFTSNGGTLNNAEGGGVTFNGDSTAGSAVITANGGTATDAGGGVTRFRENSHAGSAALVATGGTNGGAGGAIYFKDNSTGDTASVYLSGNGKLDISGRSGPGATIGSLTGDGNVFLGAQNLTVLGLPPPGMQVYPTPTPSFSGVIQDGTTLTGFSSVQAGGSFTLAGGELALSGKNTYTGPTTVNGGNLIAASTQALGLNSAVTVNANSSLGLNFNTTIGSLAGGGANSVVQGAYSFGPSAVTLTVGTLNTDTTYSGTIQDGHQFQPVPSQAMAAFQNAVVSDYALSLTKVGTGTLNLTGTNTYTGDTNINGGTLAVNGSLASPNVFINPGGALGGSGIVSGVVMNGGVIKPGNSPGILNIAGSYTQLASGTLQIAVAGAQPGQYSVLAVAGKASLAGTVQVLRETGATLKPGDTLKILTAIGGVTGTFSTAINPFATGSLLGMNVIYEPNDVLLVFGQNPISSLPGLTPPQSAVAGALDGILSDPRAAKVIAFLNGEPLASIPGDLDKLNPEELTSIFHLAKSLANVQTANIQRRLEELRSENPEAFAALDRLTGAGASGPVGRRSKAVAPAEDERWGIWFTGSGEFTQVGNRANAAGFSLDSSGVTAGVDYRFTDHFAAGISLGYMNTTASLSNGGKIDVDGGRVGAYATYFDRGFYLDAAVSGGANGYSTRRTTPNNTTATASPQGTEVNLLLATGYDWKWKGLTIGPTASFQYTNVQLDGFTESGTFAPLRVATQNADSARSALGFHATFDKKVGRAIIRPEVRAAWQHEFGDTSYSLTSSFATLGGSAFTVAGPATGRDSLLVGAGLSVLFNERFSIYAYYDGELLRANYSSHNVSAGFRYRF
jgi:outer membrane autotransporter protein